MFDLATDHVSQHLIADFYEAGKPVAAVCHGPAAFVGVKTKDGKHLLEGRQATGFSNAEEKQGPYNDLMPFLLETRMVEAGAKYTKAEKDWGEKVVVDGLVITGQNPASAKGIGEAIVKAIGA